MTYRGGGKGLFSYAARAQDNLAKIGELMHAIAPLSPRQLKGKATQTTCQANSLKRLVACPRNHFRYNSLTVPV
jgi:hypothetical protein